jgi:hypothetical protein
MRYTPLRALRITYDLFYPAFLLFFVGGIFLFLILISSSIFLFSLLLLFFTRYSYSFYILRLFCATRAYSIRSTVISLFYFLARTPSFFRFSISTTFFSILAFSLFLPISPLFERIYYRILLILFFITYLACKAFILNIVFATLFFNTISIN